MLRCSNSAASKTRRGAVAALVAVSITLLLGVAAISLDGGVLQDNKRRVQSAADSAAIAAATELYKSYPTIVSSGVSDPGGRGSAAALASSRDNGYPNAGTTTVVISIPPVSGPFTNKVGYAEIVITYQQPRYFSTIWGTTSIPVSARAVAKGYWGGTGNGVIVLDPTAKAAFNSSGGAAMTITGGAAMIVDSNNHDAASAVTGGGSATATRFDVTGGATGTYYGTLNTGTLPIPDPLAYLPVPTRPPNGTLTTTSIGNGNRLYVLTPGSFSNLPSVNVGDVVVFKQASANSNGGIYYIDGGGFTSTGATIMMDSNTSGGVMIYNHPTSSAQSQSIGISGNSAGSVNLSPLTSGPYAGILMWQDRTATQSLSISGQGSFNLTGTFYAANALLNVSGGGAAHIGSQYISRTLNVTGNGGVTIDYTDQGTARKREVRLVE